MTYPQAIVIAAAIVAGSIVMMSDNPAESAFGGGEYVLVPSSQHKLAYRLNTRTGEVGFCAPGLCMVIPWKTE